jgi:hypothetical protein
MEIVGNAPFALPLEPIQGASVGAWHIHERS